MSNRSLFLKHGYIYENAPLVNGLGRFIPQLQRITIKFCKERPASFGVRLVVLAGDEGPCVAERCNQTFDLTRQFIEHDVVQFAKEHPHVAIYLKPRRHRAPVLVAEYRKSNEASADRDALTVIVWPETGLHSFLFLLSLQEKVHVSFVVTVNGHRHWHCFRDATRDQFASWLDVYAHSSGREFQFQQKHHYTDTLSIQGMWHPFVHSEPSSAAVKFPNVSIDRVAMHSKRRIS